MGTLRRSDRAAVRAGGVRVLHRGDLPRHLPLRAGPGVAARCTSRPASSWRVSGAASAFFVTLVNAFMNAPPASRSRRRLDVDPLAAMWSPSWAHQTVHVLLSCYQATAFAMVGIHAAAPAARPGARRSTARRWRSRCRSRASRRCCSRCRAIARPSTSRGAQPLKLAALRRSCAPSAGAAAHRRLARLDTRRVPRRDRDPGRAVVPRLRRPDATVSGPRGVSARRVAARAGRAHLRFQVMVGRGTAMAALAALAVAASALAPRGAAGRAALAAGAGRWRARWGSWRSRRAGW